MHLVTILDKLLDAKPYHNLPLQERHLAENMTQSLKKIVINCIYLFIYLFIYYILIIDIEFS